MKNIYETCECKQKIDKKYNIVIFAMVAVFLLWVAYFAYNSYSKKCSNVESITHMMVTGSNITKDNITHEFVSAVICGDYLYVTVFLHEENQPVNFSSVSTIGDMQYSIYDEDNGLLELSSFYGNVVHLQAKLAKKSRNHTESFYIYSYDKEMVRLELVDFSTIQSILMPLEDVQRNATVKVVPKYSNGRLRIFVWLSDAPFYCFNLDDMYLATKNGQWFGYSESSVYLVDDSNKIHRYTTDSEESRLYLGYHCYFFDSVEKGNKYTLTIPSISYTKNDSKEIVTIEGPFTFQINV